MLDWRRENGITTSKGSEFVRRTKPLRGGIGTQFCKYKHLKGKEKWVWIVSRGVHSGGIIWGSRDKKSLNEFRSCRLTGGTNSRIPLLNQDLSIVGRVTPDNSYKTHRFYVGNTYIMCDYNSRAGLFLDMPNPYLTLTPEVQLRLYGLGLVRFVRTREPPKHISLVVSETYIMSDHNSRTGLFLDTLHPSDNVTFLKS